jgi:D-glycero-alpha-D-manno-heptose 1-phosphate guanylyltransferase
MIAIILAGGLGTRLHPITNDKYPKCMVPINDRPFVEYLLDEIIKYNINQIVFSVGHKHEHIIRHFKSHYKGIPIDYAIEREPLGTGGGIKLAMNKSLTFLDHNCIVINGDTFTTINLDKMMSFHAEKSSPITIAVKFVGNVSRYGCVKFNDNKKITKFIEKGSVMPGYINAGVYIIREDQRFYYLEDKGSFEELLQRVPNDVYAYEGDFDFIDIGVPEEYLKFAEREIDKAII